MSGSTEEIMIGIATCNICTDMMVDARILQCGHTLCLPCAMQIGTDKFVKCPECREVTSTTAFELPRNQRICSLARQILESKVKKVRAKEELDRTLTETKEKLKVLNSQEEELLDCFRQIRQELEQTEARVKQKASEWRNKLEKTVEWAEKSMKARETFNEALAGRVERISMEQLNYQLADPVLGTAPSIDVSDVKNASRPLLEKLRKLCANRYFDPGSLRSRYGETETMRDYYIRQTTQEVEQLKARLEASNRQCRQQ